MKKIIFVAYNLNPTWGSEFTRASRWLEIVCRHYKIVAFTELKHKQDLMSNEYPNTEFNFIEQSPFWYWLSKKTYLPVMAVVGSMFFSKSVKRILQRQRIDDYEFVHCITPAGVHSYNSLYKLGLPTIIGPLGGGLPSPPGFEKAFQEQYIRTFLRDLIYYIIRTLPGWRRYFENAKILILGTSLRVEQLPSKARDKCIRIPDVLVNTELFKPPLNNPKEEPIRILFVGRLVSHKGPMLLLDAVKLCIDAGIKNFVVEFAGSGPLENHLTKKIKQLGIEDHVDLLGRLEQNDLILKYQQSNIFCLPTLREPGGNSILEAMACGLPVITSDYGGPGIIVREECGIKIPMTDYETYAEDLSAALIQLIKNPELRKTLGEAGRLRAEQEFSTSASERMILSLYEQLAGNTANT